MVCFPVPLVLFAFIKSRCLDLLSKKKGVGVPFRSFFFSPADMQGLQDDMAAQQPPCRPQPPPPRAGGGARVVPAPRYPSDNQPPPQPQPLPRATYRKNIRFRML